MLLEKKLREEVSQKYKLITIRADKYNFPEFGAIDLRQINVKQADELFDKGFPFLKLRKEELAPGVKNLVVVNKGDFTDMGDKTPPVIIPNTDGDTSDTKTVNNKAPVDNIHTKRANKQYINKLLALNWVDLSFDDKVVFNNSEKYFLEKKTLMLTNGDIKQQMSSLHSKVKAIDPDPKNDDKRKAIMDQLDNLDTTKAENWLVIDIWKEITEEVITETDTEKAVRLAIEKDKRIKANKIYIYRAEKMLNDMPRETAKQISKIKSKQLEITKRKKELSGLVKSIKDKK